MAVLTLLGTMVVGYLLIRPVSDRWAGSADEAGSAEGVVGEAGAAVEAMQPPA